MFIFPPQDGSHWLNGNVFFSSSSSFCFVLMLLLLLQYRRWPVGVLPRIIVSSWKQTYSALASEENGNAMRLVLDKTSFLCNITNRTALCSPLALSCMLLYFETLKNFIRGAAWHRLFEAALRNSNKGLIYLP